MVNFYNFIANGLEQNILSCQKQVEHRKRASPSACLVRLALDRWSMKRQRADNTSVIVVEFLAEGVASVNDHEDAVLDPVLDEQDSYVSSTPLSPLRLSNNSNLSFAGAEKRPRTSLPLSKEFGDKSFSCCRPIFKNFGENCRREEKSRRRTLAGTSTISSERKLFKIPVTPEQRTEYSALRPGWKGFL